MKGVNRLGQVLVVVTGGLLAAACSGNSGGGDPDDLPRAPEPPDIGAEVRIPEGAVQVEDDLYMMPVGVTDDGYHQYTPHSTDPDRAVITLIHYPDGEGGFTPDKSEAVRGPAE
ncbi:hypothetical protein DFR31_1437 [Alkalispirillum mobile]|uniref:Uncharacterized protein n=1 Tax=Alkalispirillum mobile TaxID=85925 RepID=A0A498C6J6_9GAMM|nr:hypothetical protein [Alkalispirillum mobile]RLK51495.1 hypothetical protein DFR31_1437 [Alkalispirillum mobile]